MRVLSLTQPWATLMAIGAKKIETRSWRVNYEGPIAIHAARNFPRGAREIAKTEPFLSVLRAARIPDIDFLPLGQILAIGQLCDVVRITSKQISCDGFWRQDLDEPLIEWSTLIPPNGDEREFGDYMPGRFAWIFASVVRVRPVDFKNGQGLRKLPPEVEDQLVVIDG